MATAIFQACLPTGLGPLNLNLYNTDGTSIVADQAALEGTIPGQYEWAVTVATFPSEAIAQVGYADGTLILSEWVALADGAVVRIGDAASQASVDDLGDDIAAVAAKTALIGTGLALVHSPVTPEGTIPEITSGDSYTEDINRAFEWSMPASKFGDLTDATVMFQINGFGCACGSKIGPLQGEILDGNLESQRARVQLTSAQSTTAAGQYRWEVQITTAAGRVFTPLKGETLVVKSLIA